MSLEDNVGKKFDLSNDSKKVFRYVLERPKRDTFAPGGR